MVYVPTRPAPLNMKPDVRKGLPQQEEAAALKTLDALFNFNDAADAAEASNPRMDKIRRCNRHIAANGPCGLALRKDARCDFHRSAFEFRATGFGEDDIFAGAPARDEIKTRLAALKA